MAVENKIPKIIHYCWFGKGQMPELEQKCVDSWKKLCPDFRFVRWDESNFDINSCDYTKQAAQLGKWSFVSDYVRLKALYEYGGFYFDTDVELLRTIEELRAHQCFIGFETESLINNGQGMGAVPKLQIIRELMIMYENMDFITAEGTLNMQECPIYLTNFFLGKGLVLNGQKQMVEEVCIYPKEYFCPKSYLDGKIVITEKTYSIHHFRGSWKAEKELKVEKYMRFIRRICGIQRGDKILQYVFKTKDRLKQYMRR